MNPRPCPTCGADVVGAPDQPLDAAAHPLGQWDARGAKLTARELRAGTQGHRRHVCGPLPTPATPPPADQLALDL